MMSESQSFQEAITAVKSGDRIRGRNLLLKLVEKEPQHEMAWLWLSELVDDLEDKIIALENALTINPNRQKVQTRLEQLRQQQVKSTPPKPVAPPVKSDIDPLAEKWDEAINAVHIGLERKARRLLQEIVRERPDHAQAWWQLSLLLDTPEDRIVALEHVVKADPEHYKARELLTQLQMNQQNALALGKAYEAQGDLKKAAEAYKAAVGHAPVNADRLIAQKRLAEVEQQLQYKTLKMTSPVTTFVRLIVGPPILYGMLIFVHIGLNPLSLSPLFCLGGLAVLLGSAVVVGVQYPPQPSIWKTILGVERPDPLTKGLLGLLGLLVLMAPFLFFFWSAMNRLEVYRPIFWQTFTP